MISHKRLLSQTYRLFTSVYYVLVRSVSGDTKSTDAITTEGERTKFKARTKSRLTFQQRNRWRTMGCKYHSGKLHRNQEQQKTRSTYWTVPTSRGDNFTTNDWGGFVAWKLPWATGNSAMGRPREHWQRESSSTTQQERKSTSLCSKVRRHLPFSRVQNNLQKGLEVRHVLSNIAC